jgi:hypothetical protein
MSGNIGCADGPHNKDDQDYAAYAAAVTAPPPGLFGQRNVRMHLAMRMTLRRMTASGELEPGKAATVVAILNSDPAMAQTEDHAMLLLHQDHKEYLLNQPVLAAQLNTPQQGGTARRLGDGTLLQFLWGNREQILQFVLEVWKTFFGGGSPMPQQSVNQQAEPLRKLDPAGQPVLTQRDLEHVDWLVQCMEYFKLTRPMVDAVHERLLSRVC